jgi:thioredoxin-like negative regulator of GroEL
LSLVVAVAAVLASSGRGSAQAKRIAWHATLNEALAAAKKSNKLVMLSLHTEWCTWCQKLTAETWPAEVVVAKSASFECVQVNPEKTEVSDRYNNGEFPRILFLTAAGDVARVTAGFLPPDGFVQEMEQAQESAKKLREAQELERKLAETPGDRSLPARAGGLYLQIGNQKRALELLKPVYDHLSELDEKLRGDAAADYGTALLMDEQFEPAAAALLQFTKQFPAHQRIWQGRFALGFALANLDKLAEARDQWKLVAEGDPHGPYAERARGLVERVNEELKPK